jgi:hypothetical protein
MTTHSEAVAKVAAELKRRGFTLGWNQPGVDLKVTHETVAQFYVAVRGNKNRGDWLVELEGRPTIPDLYYILTYIDEERTRFFILTQDEARELRDQHKRARGAKGALDQSGRFRGFPFGFPRESEDRWDKLPGQRPSDNGSLAD